MHFCIMRRYLNRDIILWLIYSVYLLILILPNMILPENGVFHWYDKLLRACTIILFLYPAKLMAVYLGVPSLIRKVVYNQASWIVVFGKVLLSIVIGVVLYRMALYLYIYPYIYERSPDDGQFFAIGRFLSNFADLTVPMLLFGAIWMYDERLKADQEKTVLELQFLKNQTSPHFLFNALNGIFALVRKNDEKAAPAIMKLSGILRYLLYETTSPRIAIQKELDVIHQYIDIQKLRFGSTLQLIIHENKHASQYMISPGLLLPLIENAFKFGFSDALNVIYIEIKIEMMEHGQFSFEIKNHLSASNPTDIGGLGLKNLSRRLQLEYPGDHQLLTKEENGYFIAQLHLRLQ